MANRWGIPLEVEKHVLERDSTCVYCGSEFSIETRKTKASWEHIVNDIRINGTDNIALCCKSCNASKGAKLLSVWLNGEYCKNKNITPETVAEIVKKAIANPPKLKNK